MKFSGVRAMNSANLLPSFPNFISDQIVVLVQMKINRMIVVILVDLST